MYYIIWNGHMNLAGGGLLLSVTPQHPGNCMSQLCRPNGSRSTEALLVCSLQSISSSLITAGG